jgi:predicted deacylase
MRVITVGDVSCQPGEIRFGKLACAYLPDSSEVSIPLIVLNGKEEGPVLWLGAAVHGA